jgi:hypothetical protein
MGGGPDPTQIQAANANLKLANTMAGIAGQQQNNANAAFNQVFPFAQNQMQNGLPFYNQLTSYNAGNAAQANAQANANLMRSMAGATPGSRAYAETNLQAQNARNFDSGLENAQMAQQTAKNNGAAMLTGQQQIANPLGWYQGASGSNASVIGGNLQHPNPIAGVLGGAASGLASAIPF